MQRYHLILSLYLYLEYIEFCVCFRAVCNKCNLTLFPPSQNENTLHRNQRKKN